MKKILIARPHAFINEYIQRIFEQAGYRVAIVHSFDELRQVNFQDIVGTVISLAVTSPVDEPVEAVLNYLRNDQKDLTLIFASLMPADMTSRILFSAGVEYDSIVSVRKDIKPSDKLLGKDVHLLLQKDEILHGADSDLVQSMLSRYCC